MIVWEYSTQTVEAVDGAPLDGIDAEFAWMCRAGWEPFAVTDRVGQKLSRTVHFRRVVSQ